MKLKIIFFILSLFTLLNSLYSKEDVKSYGLEAGIKSAFTTGISENYGYYWPFVKANYDFKKISLNGGYSRYINFQISDADTVYQYINLHKFQLSSTFIISKSLEIYIDGDYSRGEANYSKLDYQFGGEINTKKWSYTLEYGISSNQYTINNINADISGYDIYLEAAYYKTNKISYDISFSRIASNSLPLNFSYSKNKVRGGTIIQFAKRTYLSSGLAFAYDSSSYFGSEIDASLSITIFKNIKFLIFGQAAFNSTISTSSSSSKGIATSDTTITDDSYFSTKLFTSLSYKY